MHNVGAHRCKGKVWNYVTKNLWSDLAMCFGNEHLSAEVTRHNSSAMTLQLEDKPHQYLQKKKPQNNLQSRH